jgi:hypothetical protein
VCVYVCMYIYIYIYIYIYKAGLGSRTRKCMSVCIDVCASYTYTPVLRSAQDGRSATICMYVCMYSLAQNDLLHAHTLIFTLSWIPMHLCTWTCLKIKIRLCTRHVVLLEHDMYGTKNNSARAVQQCAKEPSSSDYVT